MDDQRLEAMEPEALSEALSDWLDRTGAEDFDPAVMDAYLDILARKDPVASDFDPVSAEAAFRTRRPDLFAAEPPRPVEEKSAGRRRRLLFGRVAAVAAVVTLSMGLAAQSMGLDLFGAIARWSKEEFLFATGQGADGPEGYTDNVYQEDFYSHGQAALDAHHVDVPMMPMWNPAWKGDEFPGLEVTVTEEADGTLLLTEDHRTESGAGYTFEVRARGNAEAALADLEGVDGPDTVVYEFDGRTYYILPTGEGTYTATWAVGRYSGKIYGDMDLETAKHFVRSVTQLDQIPYEPPDMSTPPEYGTIQEAMEAAGIDAGYAPAWLPEGFVPVESSVYVFEDVGSYTAHLFYTDVEGQRDMSISCDLETNPDSAGVTVFEKDDTPVVEYARGGVTFYIMNNLTRKSVAWTDGAFMGSFSGELTVEECEKMIDSIPRYAE